MKVNRLLALILIFTLFGAATVFADTVYERYIAKKITVKVNSSALDSGLMVDINKNDVKVETPMVSLNEIVNQFGGIVSKDDKTVIFRPNVQMSVVSTSDNKALRIIEKGNGKVPFYVVAFMDSIYTDISNIKITVLDPFGDEIEIDNNEYSILKEDRSKEVFTFYSKPLELKIKWTGKYTVNLSMKEVGGSKYYKVGQYVISYESK